MLTLKLSCNHPKNYKTHPKGKYFIYSFFNYSLNSWKIFHITHSYTIYLEVHIFWQNDVGKRDFFWVFFQASVCSSYPSISQQTDLSDGLHANFLISAIMFFFSALLELDKTLARSNFVYGQSLMWIHSWFDLQSPRKRNRNLLANLGFRLI